MKKFSLAALLGAAVSAQNSDTGIQQLFGIKQTGSTAGSGSETIQISNGDQTNSIQLVDGSGSDTFTTSSSGSSSSGFGNEVVITSGQPSVVRAGNGDVSATTILLSGGGGASSNDQAEMEKLLASMRSQASAQLPSQQTQEFQVNTVHVLNQAAQNSVSAQSPFDSTFVRFATVDEMDMLILTGDITAIIKLIQTVAMDNSVPCDKKIAYLLELLGRLRTAVQKKSKLSLKLKLVIQTSINEINKLQIQLEDSRKALNQLGLDDLKNSSKRINKQLEDKYAAFNDVQGQIPVLQAQLLGTERQIDILTKNSENQRSRIGNDQLKLVQMRSEIGKIQTRLSQLLDIESAIKDRLSKSDQATSGNSGRITELRAKITSTQADLKRLKQDYDQANSAVKDQQVKVERIRTDIAVAETKRDKYLRQIMSFEDKINIEKKKNSTENLNKLTEMINSLKGVLPSVSSAIDKHYYNCYGAGNVKTQKVGDVTVYIVSAAKIADYLKSVYGSTIKVPNLNGDISFNRVDIFGSGWTGKYGYPFPQNAFGNQDFSFSNSFSCMNSNSPATGYGTITAIGSDYMEAQDEKGAKRKLILGSCSRLESTQAVPKIGQTIYYWADVGSRGSNLYQASCFG